MRISRSRTVIVYDNSNDPNFEVTEEKYSQSEGFIRPEDLTNSRVTVNNNSKDIQSSVDLAPPRTNDLFICTTCSLDFPSLPYLDRHFKTKKHQRGLKMAEKGLKFIEKKKYVRKRDADGFNAAKNLKHKQQFARLFKKTWQQLTRKEISSLVVKLDCNKSGIKIDSVMSLAPDKEPELESFIKSEEVEELGGLVTENTQNLEHPIELTGYIDSEPKLERPEIPVKIVQIYNNEMDVTRQPEVDSILQEISNYKEVSLTKKVTTPGRAPVLKQSDTNLFFCSTCSLDFPTLPYIQRHYKTKKHQTALAMEQRGRKFNQKRKYVRKSYPEGTSPQMLSTMRMRNQQQMSKIVRKSRRLLARKFFNVKLEPNREGSSLDIIDFESLKTGVFDAPDVRESVMDVDEDHSFESQPFLPLKPESLNEFQLKSSIEPQSELVPQPEPNTIKKPPKTMKSGPLNGPYVCRTCSLDFPSEAYLNRHKETKKHQRALSMEKRGRKFNQKRKYIRKNPPMMYQHQLEVPTGLAINQISDFVNFQSSKNEKFSCKICSKTFKLRCHFTQHVNIVHSGIRRHKCDKCGKRYPLRSLLEKHKENHTDDKPFKCSRCLKSYINKIDLKRHEKLHDNIRDHVCGICGSGFVRFDHLQKHYGVHRRKLTWNWTGMAMNRVERL